MADATDPVRLTIVAHEPAAAMLCGLLESAGVRCMQRITDVGFGAGGEVANSGGGAREVLVAPADLERARALLAELD